MMLPHTLTTHGMVGCSPDREDSGGKQFSFTAENSRLVAHFTLGKATLAYVPPPEEFKFSSTRQT